MTKQIKNQEMTAEQAGALLQAAEILKTAGIIESASELQGIGASLTEKQKLALDVAESKAAVDVPWYKRGWIQMTGIGLGGALVGSLGTLGYQKFFGNNDSDNAPIGNTGPSLAFDDQVNNPAGHNQYTPSAQLVH